MKSSSILVPAILIACLLALALIISGVFGKTNKAAFDSKDSVNGTISTNPSTIEETSIYDGQTKLEEESGDNFAGLEEVNTNEYDPSSPAYSTSNPDGSYLIIAGTFRQRANANTRVAELKKKGFSATEMSIFDRGTFAVALVDRTDRYAKAAELARSVKDAGFEVTVYRKR